VAAPAVNEAITAEIAQEHPQWNARSFICREDLNRFRSQFVHSLLQKEKGELSHLENEIVNSINDYETISRDVESSFNGQWSFGERLADIIASFGGSWKFILLFALFIIVWIFINVVALVVRPFDPYPFILLNLILSCLAAVQAPIIMMSQNRQEAKDRLRSQHDYQVNLKAELEIRHLHEKIDHLLSHQWERLSKIQEVQIEILQELSRRR
jgi:uncharacterized membrane protein